MPDLPLSDQVLHGARNILDRDIGIDAVLIEEVNGIYTQTLQRLLGDLPDAFRPAIGRARSAGAEVEAKLRGDDDALLHGRERFTDEFLVREGAVDLGGVEERDAALDRGPDQCHHLFPVRSWATMIIQAHATKADGRDFEAAFSEFAFLHASLLTFQLRRKLSVRSIRRNSPSASRNRRRDV